MTFVLSFFLFSIRMCEELGNPLCICNYVYSNFLRYVCICASCLVQYTMFILYVRYEMYVRYEIRVIFTLYSICLICKEQKFAHYSNFLRCVCICALCQVQYPMCIIYLRYEIFVIFIFILYANCVTKGIEIRTNCVYANVCFVYAFVLCIVVHYAVDVDTYIKSSRFASCIISPRFHIISYRPIIGRSCTITILKCLVWLVL